MPQHLYRGWYQVGFEREIRDKVTPLRIGNLRLLLVKQENEFGAYNATCPHRGAHLAFGGTLDRGAIICPFHGYRIGLGSDSDCQFKTPRYRTLAVGGLLFVLLSERHENGLTRLLEELNATHYLVPGFTMTAQAPAELVVENGFDPAHFQSVHRLKRRPNLKLSPGDSGELHLSGTFYAEAFETAWHNGAVQDAGTEMQFLAQVISPNVCVSRLGENTVISGSTPNGDGSCTIRVSVAAPATEDGSPPSQQAIRALLRDSKLAYEQDLVIWENRIHDAPNRLTPEDGLILAFHEFCTHFEGEEIAVNEAYATCPVR